MSFVRISKTLTGDSPGRSTELNYFRIGPEDAVKKVYLQAALHADEQPGIMVLHHLLPLLRAAAGVAEGTDDGERAGHSYRLDKPCPV